jgi:hypothetical protein
VNDRTRPLLLITDRISDLFPVLQHASTYQVRNVVQGEFPHRASTNFDQEEPICGIHAVVFFQTIRSACVRRHVINVNQFLCSAVSHRR